ncbi:hypothetical protein B6Q94_28610, partial [Escherichia coli]|nr:hypothetical protein [Escherichia coli]
MLVSQELRSNFYREEILMETVFDALKAMGKASSQEVATQEDIKTETVADIVQPLEKRVDNLVLPSLRQANRELRRAKSHVQKWERI